MRQIVRAMLPLGTVSCSTRSWERARRFAAARAVGYQSIGLEIDPQYFDVAENAIPNFAALQLKSAQLPLEFPGDGDAAAERPDAAAHRKSGEYVEKGTAELIEIYLEQANVF